jgi:hypothetical protein
LKRERERERERERDKERGRERALPICHKQVMAPPTAKTTAPRDPSINPPIVPPKRLELVLVLGLEIRVSVKVIDEP